MVALSTQGTRSKRALILKTNCAKRLQPLSRLELYIMSELRMLSNLYKMQSNAAWKI
jgi:hypothetical protein